MSWTMPRLSAAAPHTVQMNVMASIGKSSFAVFLYHTGGADRKDGQWAKKDRLSAVFSVKFVMGSDLRNS